MRLWLLRPTEIGKERMCWFRLRMFVIRAHHSAEARRIAGEGEGGAFWKDTGLSSCIELKSEGKIGFVLSVRVEE